MSEPDDRYLRLRSLRDQAGVFAEQGDFDKAMALLKEAEQICRELGDNARLVETLAWRGTMLVMFKGPGEGLPILKQAARLADSFGLTELSAKLQGDIKTLRQNSTGCLLLAGLFIGGLVLMILASFQ